ncbi:apolipoprotein N-acyltransferase [Haloferula luteola]|uniref:Apolipoprotein N-acyltransferase n=1 Tax=Haloferula luteola TaxID=595692 RepID=A0A840V4P1_9BACT|nr:apolipoprotein N-acyltransferase [Haloferula luteola]MBB5350604.1 apolipoprotein N-acyltransferase [Haloferula luteola]
MKLGKSGPWLRLVAAVASGAGSALVLPPYDGGGLVWVALLPALLALWSLEGRRGWKGFGLGWLMGFSSFLISLHWLTEVSSAGWVALSTYLALFPALWGAWVAKVVHPWIDRAPKDESRIAMKMRQKEVVRAGHWQASWKSLRIALSAAAVWCVLEWLRGWLFTGFGWNTLGVGFHRTPVMAQSADLLGICGLAFVPVFLQAVIVQTGRRLVAEARAGKLRPHIDFGVAAVLVALSFCYGVWRLSREGKGDSIRLQALLVQLDIPQEAARRLWTSEEIHFGYEDETLAGLKQVEAANEAKIRAAQEGELVELARPDWILWPEVSLDGRILRDNEGAWATWQENLDTWSVVNPDGEFTLVLGLLEEEGVRLGDQLVRKEDGRVWNSLVMLQPGGAMQTFRKHHLVVFGEYIPWVEELPFLRKIYEQQSGAQYAGAISKGVSLEPLSAQVNGEEFGVIPSVCFEDTVPRLLRKFVRGGPQVIVNVTNDGWFKDSPAAAQHFANARFRAIELRRPMVRCANTGVSAAIDTRGSTVNPTTGTVQELRDEQGSHLTRGSLLVEVEIPKHPSFSLYAVVGDSGVLALGLLGLVVGGWVNRSEVLA